MAKKTYASMMKLGPEAAMRFLASIFASGKNPDGSDFFLPTGAELTLDPTNLALSANQQVVSPTHTISNSNDAQAGVDCSAAPTAGQKLVIHDLLVSTGAAIAVTLKEETSGTIIFGPFYMAANSTVILSRNRLAKLPVANKKLRAFASGAGNVTIETWCSSEA
jgi:hypothetical protein